MQPVKREQHTDSSAQRKPTMCWCNMQGDAQRRRMRSADTSTRGRPGDGHHTQIRRAQVQRETAHAQPTNITLQERTKRSNDTGVREDSHRCFADAVHVGSCRATRRMRGDAHMRKRRHTTGGASICVRKTLGRSQSWPMAQPRDAPRARQSQGHGPGARPPRQRQPSDALCAASYRFDG